MIGDADDMRSRLRLTLPAHWFSDSAPVLDGLLAGLSVLWAGLYNLLEFVRHQSRIATATGAFLDVAASDFFGAEVKRRLQEADTEFRARIQRAMRRERATRAAITDAAREAGFTVRIFEPARPADTGAYNVPSSIAWNVSGGWGSMQMPLECLITARRSASAVDGEFWPGIADAMPAGGVGWVHIEA